jgi:hypothetical protein
MGISVAVTATIGTEGNSILNIPNFLINKYNNLIKTNKKKKKPIFLSELMTPERNHMCFIHSKKTNKTIIISRNNKTIKY